MTQLTGRTKLKVKCECLTIEEELAIEEKVCEICEGCGRVNEYTRIEGNYVWDGEKDCICQKKEDFEE